MAGVRTVGALLAVVGVAACTAIAGLGGDFEEARADGGVLTDNALADGAAPRPDVTTPSDADAPDVADASLDAYDPTLPPSLPPVLTCPTAGARICWTFDGDNRPPDYGVGDHVGTPTVDSVVAYGGTGKSLDAVSQAGGGEALVFNDALPNPMNLGDRIVVQFDFNVASIDNDVNVGVLSINDRGIGVGVTATGCDGPCIEENHIVDAVGNAMPSAPPHPEEMKLTTGVWNHATVTLTAGANMSWASDVRVTNASTGFILATRDFGAFPAGIPSLRGYYIYVGAFWGQVAGNTHVYVDDVRSDYVPATH